MNNLMPRFRGRAFEKDGGWSWDVHISLLGDNEEGLMMNSNIIFASKELAVKDMKIAIKESCDRLQESVMGKATGEYIDMKTNETLKWDTSGYN